MNLDHLSGAEIASWLNLSPLAGEGGMWAPVHRDESGNTIYFLMIAPDFSSWHRLKESETWILLAGAPVALHTIDSSDALDERHAFFELSRAATKISLTYTVRAGVWMAAESLGEWSLLACSVTPAFTQMELADRDRVTEWTARFGAEVGRFFHE